MAKTLFKKTLSEFLDHLNEHSIATATKFVVISTPKSFRAEKVSPTKNQTLHWKDGIPYFCFGTRKYQCHHGKDTDLNKKKKYAKERDKKAMTDHSVKRYNSKSKKLDCPASFNVNRVIWIPEFKLSGLLSERYEQNKVSQLIRSKLENGECVGEDCFMYKLPNIEEHSNHPIGDSEPVDSRVRDYIRQLVGSGERNAVVVAKMLESFVESQLHQTNRLRRRFYPNLKTVRNIISAEKCKLSKSATDQENGEVLRLIIDPVLNLDNHIGVLEVVNIEEVCNESRPDRTEEFSENEVGTPEFQELSGNHRHLVLNDCCSTLANLQSLVEFLDDGDLNTLNNTLKDLYQMLSCKVSTETTSSLPVEAETQVLQTS